MTATLVSMTAAPVKRRRRRRSNSARKWSRVLGMLFVLAAITGIAVAVVQSEYSISVRSPLTLGWQWPVIISPRVVEEATKAAQADQFGLALTAYQQYACNKFGSECRVALAVQRAENPRGDCEIYHYNTDGTLDWGYFQINTVHLKRPGVNLHALLDCRANIDFAYQLYTERGFQPWTTYRNGAYRQFLRNFEPRHGLPHPFLPSTGRRDLIEGWARRKCLGLLFDQSDCASGARRGQQVACRLMPLK